jgi:hypothetical protein
MPNNKRPLEVDEAPSIVDVLLGRHQHQPLMKVTLSQRLYANYWIDAPSLEAELRTAGRHRNRPELERVN